MIGNERAIATGLVALLLVLWLGFLVHVDPRWPGSLAGSAVGILGATLMQAPFLYLIIKRTPLLRRLVTRVVPMSRLLAWHIYAGIAGPILGLVHSGHKFDSRLGTALVGLMLLEVASGFLGRYLLAHVARDRAEKSSMLERLQTEYRRSAEALKDRPETVGVLRLLRGLFALPFGGALIHAAFTRAPTAADPLRAVALSEAIADVESSIAADDFLRTLFGCWLRIHIAAALLLDALLFLHIWTGVYFGLRWL